MSLAGDHQQTPTPVCLVLCCCPDVVIDHPSHGIILKVKAAEIVPTTQFNTNLTFRFPRVESIRRDKVKAVDYAANHATRADSCSFGSLPHNSLGMTARHGVALRSCTPC